MRASASGQSAGVSEKEVESRRDWSILPSFHPESEVIANDDRLASKESAYADSDAFEIIWNAYKYPARNYCRNGKVGKLKRGSC